MLDCCYHFLSSYLLQKQNRFHSSEREREEHGVKKTDTFGYDLALRVVKSLNILLVSLPFAVCWYLAYADRIASPYYARGNYLVVGLFVGLYFLYGRVYEAFLISMNPVSEIVFSQGLSAFIADSILYVVIWLLTKHLPNPLPLIGTLAVQVGLSAVWSGLARLWYFHTWTPRRTLIIYDQRQDMEQMLDEPNMRRKFNIVERLNVEEALSGQLPELQEVDAVFLCGIHSHERNLLLKECIAADVVTYITPRIGDVLMKSAQPVHMFHLPVLRTKRCKPSPEYLFVKRVMDICISLVALIIASPVLLATAIIIKATDGGPVFYKQLRMTKDGKEFLIYKFRSMRVDAEKDGVARLSTGVNDDRVTPVGRVIRRFRIDEFPQLLCVLRGHMSIVGPRPERPEIARQYEESLPEFGLRLQVKAGLTGYAQVYGKYNTPPYDKLQMDLLYISHLSIVEDLRILFATVKILFFSISTEGIQEGTVTAEKHTDSVTSGALTNTTSSEHTSPKVVG